MHLNFYCEKEMKEGFPRKWRKKGKCFDWDYVIWVAMFHFQILAFFQNVGVCWVRHLSLFMGNFNERKVLEDLFILI